MNYQDYTLELSKKHVTNCSSNSSANYYIAPRKAKNVLGKVVYYTDISRRILSTNDEPVL